MLPARQNTWIRIFVGTQLSLKSLQPHFKSEEDCDAFGDRSTRRGATSESLGGDAPGSSHMSSHSEELVQTPDTISIKVEEDIGGGLPAVEDCNAFGERSTQRNANSEILGVDAPGSSHMSSHSEELKILSVYGKGEGPLAVDGHDTLFTASEVEALNSLSADHGVAKSLERGERLVCREELSVQQTPDTISIKVEEDIGGGMPAVEDGNDIRDCSTQRGAISESLLVDAPGSSHMLRILSVYGQGEGPLAVDGHDTLFAASEPEALRSLSTDHSVAKSLNCSVRLVRLEELTGHQGGRKGRPGVLCGKVVPNDATMIAHMSSDSGEKPYRCDQCTKCFSQKGTLKRHLRTHSGEKPYKCDQCTMRFSHGSALKFHMSTHTGEKPYRCDQCTRSFIQSYALKCHMRTHSGEKPYKCDQCTMRFIHTSARKRHMSTHTGEKPYKCDQCMKCFSQKGHRKSHMMTHSGEKPYRCDQCTKRFSLTRYLTIHMRTHTGEKPYRCDQCMKCFHLGSSLKFHMTTHTGEKPYRCDQCMKCFSQKGTLKHHMRTHSGEKPYRCDQCMKCFGQKGTLKTHMMTHSGEKPYK
ncbi:zinc finger protein 260-like [Gadus chalcogrammus]|uniref:zinc finger protein 260-like n=1 Tax=Gadus chalcogrammus TaxID=1042646 RepID=UPI0024C45AF0|nr:zinc finger protein 260-like [Gadus chalcogrammus]